MAFEAYLQQHKLRPSRGRRITIIVSAVVHALAVLAAVAYSFWHVEELTPPTVTVTFISAAAAPPPPPPPPPLGGGAPSPKHKAIPRPKVDAHKPTEIVQPKPQEKEPPQETPKEDPKEAAKDDDKANAEVGGGGTAAGVKGGVAGGIKGGVVGGVVGGTANAPTPAASKFLPPQMGAQQKISGGDPDFPTHLRKSGTNYLVMAKICVSTSGGVESVTLLKRAEPTLDNNVVTRVKSSWRFRPLMANGTPAPFCYFGRFEFKSE